MRYKAGMRKMTFFTMRNLNTSAITALANQPGIDAKTREDLLEMVAFYQFASRLREELVTEQYTNRDGIFKNFDEALAATLLEQPSQDDLLGQSSQVDSEPKELETTGPNCENEGSGPLPQEGGTDKPRGKQALTAGEQVLHKLKESEKTCSCCGKNMHMTRARTKTLVLSEPIFRTKTHIIEGCRCITCNTTQEAESPQELKETIGRYHMSAVASLAALRYLYGMASCRIETYSAGSGHRVADSTQWMLFEDAASRVRRFAAFLEQKAAQAPTTHVDDTHFTILELLKDIATEQEEALKNGKKVESVRSGVHTTNLTGVFEQGKIVLFRSGLHHAGEALAKLLSSRTVGDSVVIMADALSANTSKLSTTGVKTKVAHCNSHAVRKAKELAEAEEKIAKSMGIKDHKTSEPVDTFLTKYRAVFLNDGKTKDWAPDKRLEYHRTHSLPVMEDLLRRIESDFRLRKVEPSSDLGKVYSYFKNHFTELTAFCREQGAPICNNLSERMLKGVIRHRKNSLFVRTLLGARVADIFWTILFTAKENGLEPTEYLTDLLKHTEHWSKNPEAWLPWNYKATLATLKG